MSHDPTQNNNYQHLADRVKQAEFELERIDFFLNLFGVPKEVFIGTNSTADRVEWTMKRLKSLSEQVRVTRDGEQQHADWLAMHDDYP